ncbi:MAG: NAD-dependent deacylase [Bacteriovoracaceae bacterium]
MEVKPEKFKKIVVLTGAGISADSGISTFRDANGLWEQHRIEDVATPEAFIRDPKLVWRFYSLRRINAASALPNAAHRALATFAEKCPGKITLISQNVDGLHDRADEKSVLPFYPMHGSLNQSRCSRCEIVYYDDYAYFDLSEKANPQVTAICSKTERESANYLHRHRISFQDELPLSPCCQRLLRPHIVWFGEIPLHMEEIEKKLSVCDLFVSIGTSGQVYPAAGFLQFAKSIGATTVVLNKEGIPQSPYVDHEILGNAKDIVPEFFKA